MFKFLCSLWLLFAIVGMAKANPPDADLQWQSLRHAYPNNIQVIALSPPNAVGVRTLVITEPPPDTLPKTDYQARLAYIFQGHYGGLD
jgi:hypothetical protein